VLIVKKKKGMTSFFPTRKGAFFPLRKAERKRRQSSAEKKKERDWGHQRGHALQGRKEKTIAKRLLVKKKKQTPKKEAHVRTRGAWERGILNSLVEDLHLRGERRGGWTARHGEGSKSKEEKSEKKRGGRAPFFHKKLIIIEKKRKK